MVFFQRVREVRKGIVNAISMASAVIAYGALPEPWNSRAAAVVAAVAIIVHYKVPNEERYAE